MSIQQVWPSYRFGRSHRTREADRSQLRLCGGAQSSIAERRRNARWRPAVRPKRGKNRSRDAGLKSRICFSETPARNTTHREVDMQKSGSFTWQGYARVGLAAPLVLTMSIMSVSSSLSAEAIQSRLSTSTVKAWQKLAQTPLRSQCIERFSSCRAYCSSRPHDRRSREVCRKTCRDELTQCKRTRGA